VGTVCCKRSRGSNGGLAALEANDPRGSDQADANVITLWYLLSKKEVRNGPTAKKKEGRRDWM